MRERREISRKELVLYASLAAIAGVIFIALITPQLAARTGLCGGCHAVREIYSSWSKSSHAGTPCLACHGQPGAGGFFLNLSRGARSVIDQALPGGARAAWLSDDRCLGCHERIIDDLVRTEKKTRVSHREIIAGGRRCSECHGEIGHRLGVVDTAAKRFTFDKCLICHRRGGQAEYRCNLCHQKTPVKRPTGPSAGLLDHGPKGWKNHGLFGTDVCSTCHGAEEFCGRCHRGYVEHSKWFPQQHSQTVREVGRADCATCHRRAFCDDCHRVEMPHPFGYASTHQEEEPKLCARCHNDTFCRFCHDRHTEHSPVSGGRP